MHVEYRLHDSLVIIIQLVNIVELVKEGAGNWEGERTRILARERDAIPPIVFDTNGKCHREAGRKLVAQTDEREI